MTWVIMEKEGRRDTEVSLVCRVFQDLQVLQVSRELQESLDQMARGDHLGLSDLLERRETLDSRGRWDHLELVDSVEKLDLRALQENLDPQDHLVHQDLPWRLWMTCLDHLRITTPALLPHQSSARMRLCPTATPP